jgi:hypothetical protein
MPSIGTTAFCSCGDESMGITSGARAFAAITPKPANAPVTMVNSLSANPDFAFSMKLIFLQNDTAQTLATGEIPDTHINHQTT